MNYFHLLLWAMIIVAYLLMTAVVQQDNSRVPFKTALWNSFVGPICYVVLFPCFVLVDAYISACDYIRFKRWEHKHPNYGLLNKEENK